MGRLSHAPACTQRLTAARPPAPACARPRAPRRVQLTAVVRTATEQLQKAAAERGEYQRKYGIQAVPQSMAKQLMESTQAQQVAGGGGEGGGGGGAPSRPGILA